MSLGGKRIDNGEWAYGFLKQSRDKEWTWVDSNPVFPKTVGQYTGIRDKSRKKIYEGDTLRLYIDNERKIGFVTYSNGMFGLENRTLAGWIGFLPLSRLDYLEVIGNIYEEGK